MHFHEALTIIITEREHFKKKKEKENETNILEFLTSATKILATFYIGFKHKIFFKLVFTIEALVFYIFHTVTYPYQSTSGVYNEEQRVTSYLQRKEIRIYYKNHESIYKIKAIKPPTCSSRVIIKVHGTNAENAGVKIINLTQRLINHLLCEVIRSQSYLVYVKSEFNNYDLKLTDQYLKP